MKHILWVAPVVIFLSLFVSFASPVFVYANGPIVPCGNTTNGQFLECSLCHLQVLAMRFINFMIVFSTMIATLLFIHAGILYVFAPANPNNVARAHRIFSTTLMGFILILAGWLIISFIMNSLYTGASFGSWDTILCDGTSADRTVPADGSTPGGGGGATGGTASGGGATGGTPGGTNVVPSSGTTLSEGEARRAIRDYAVVYDSKAGYVSYDNWVENPQTGSAQTTFEGWQQTSLDGTLAIIRDSGLTKDAVIITGAVDKNSELHGNQQFSHYAGYKADFEDNRYMNDYFTKYERSGFSNEGYPQYTKTIDGIVITATRESTHWDVLFMRPNQS
jgi:hypothetical protein